MDYEKHNADKAKDSAYEQYVCRTHVIPYLNTVGECKWEDNKWQQISGIDYSFKRNNEKDFHTYDIKCYRKATDCFFIETLTNSHTNSKGWYFLDESDYLTIAMPEQDYYKLFTILFKDLRNKCGQAEAYKKYNNKYTENKSEFFILPINQCKDIIKTIEYTKE
jgi:hypothetical protein